MKLETGSDCRYRENWECTWSKLPRRQSLLGVRLLLEDRVPARSCKMTGATIVLEENTCGIWVCVHAHAHRGVIQAYNYTVRTRVNGTIHRRIQEHT